MIKLYDLEGSPFQPLQVRAKVLFESFTMVGSYIKEGNQTSILSQFTYLVDVNLEVSVGKGNQMQYANDAMRQCGFLILQPYTLIIPSLAGSELGENIKKLYNYEKSQNSLNLKPQNQNTEVDQFAITVTLDSNLYQAYGAQVQNKAVDAWCLRMVYS